MTATTHDRDTRPRRMTLYQPASDWRDACPVGSGRVGAMAYGGIRNEIILLNHKQLWVPRPKPDLPDVSPHLPELRRLLAAGKYGKAGTFLEDHLCDAGYVLARPGTYQPAFDLLIDTDTRGAFRDYARTVDFDTGTATVTWTDGDVTCTRELFVSRPDDTVALKTTATGPGGITCTFSLAPHDPNAIGEAKADTGADPHQSFESRADGNRLTLIGTFSSGAQFGGVAEVTAVGGALETSDTAIRISEADSVTVLLKLFVAEPADAARERLAEEIAALNADYDGLRARHVEAHGELFGRMRLDLAGGDDGRATNERLLADGYSGDVPTALIERMFDYGRHLLISSSAPGSWPANLQGVWNGFYAPPWRSDYHNDENIQMNYWQALPGNLADVALPFFDYYEQFLDDYRVNAKCLYGCRGIFVPIAQTTHGHMGPGVWCNWTAGAGWLAQLFYDYFLFTGDEEFLRDRAVPFMKEVALFYGGFLFEGIDGKLVFSPSLSPENAPAIDNTSLVTVNATMDVAVARELLTNLCAACEHLGIESHNVRKWNALLQKLPDYTVNEDGAICEWIHPDLKDNYHHRHQSHIYPLFPGFEATAEGTPDLYAACHVAVEKRLVIGLASQTGWSLAHMANIYARLGDGNRALECLEYITRACTGPNLFTYHNDWRGQGLTLGGIGRGDRCFQIDANFGLTAAVLEMLVFSAPGTVKLLPALPDKWPAGSASGIRCRGGLTVDVAWDVPAGTFEATLTSDTDQTVTVKLPAAPADLESNIPMDDCDLGPTWRRAALATGKATTLRATLD